MTDPVKQTDSNGPVKAEISDSEIESGLQQVTAAALAQAGWMDKVRARNGERCVSANELTSLSALIVYVAHKNSKSEFRVERDLADRFNVANVKVLPSARFDEAIRYLVDQVG